VELGKPFQENRTNPEDKPPFLGTWRKVYFSVAAYLAGLIFLFYLFTLNYRIQS